MVVEDDASLREIYSIRITAEGYDVVSAGDGEEALAVAVREKPDLILSDVMMPKISGFDMLDILRSTPETADIKIIMMTALSADDQRQRGERLGANKYLVKSQVGIEDVINTIHEVLGDCAAPAQPTTPNANQPLDNSQVPTANPEPSQPSEQSVNPGLSQPSERPVNPELIQPSGQPANSEPIQPLGQPINQPHMEPQAQSIASNPTQMNSYGQPGQTQ